MSLILHANLSISLGRVSASFAESSQGAALSALFWWFIPLAALIGASIYVVWVTRFKSKYDNRIDRSVDRFRKFQDSFNTDPNPSRRHLSQGYSQRDAQINEESDEDKQGSSSLR